MSSENIKTGLKLSEAIRLIEENEGSLLRVEDDLYEYPFLKSEYWLSRTDRTYSVKLPPPKTVTVTRADIEKAFDRINLRFQYMDEFCKELGL